MYSALDAVPFLDSPSAPATSSSSSATPAMALTAASRTQPSPTQAYVVARSDLWSPYVGLQFSVLLLTLVASEAVRYFRGQRRLDYGNNDPSLVKGTVVALCTATIVQSIFTFYGGYTVFVQNWGRSQPGLRELMYGNMISDAVIASIVHSLYSWYLFTLSTGARRWAGWGLASIIMLVSTAQLICCLMAAIGFAQSSPSMSQSDVQLIRTIFRAWLGLCAGTDLIITLVCLFKANRARREQDPHHKWCICSLFWTIIWVLLPGNAIAVLTTLAAFLCQTLAEDHDYYSWLLVCLSKVHALAVLVCLNLRDDEQVYPAKRPTQVKTLLMTRPDNMPPPILIKEHGEEQLHHRSSSSSFCSTHSTASTPTTVISASQYTRHPLQIDTEDKRLRARRQTQNPSQRSYRGVLPVYSMTSLDSSGRGTPTLPLYSKSMSPTFAQVSQEHGGPLSSPSPSPSRSLRRQRSSLSQQPYQESEPSSPASDHTDDTLPVATVSTAGMCTDEGSEGSIYKIQAQAQAQASSSSPTSKTPTPTPALYNPPQGRPHHVLIPQQGVESSSPSASPRMSPRASPSAAQQQQQPDMLPAQRWAVDSREEGSRTSARAARRETAIMSDPWRDASQPTLAQADADDYYAYERHRARPRHPRPQYPPPPPSMTPLPMAGTRSSSPSPHASSRRPRWI